MFTLIVFAGALLVYGDVDGLKFSTQKDCMEAASAVVGAMTGQVTAVCKTDGGQIVSIQSRTG